MSKESNKPPFWVWLVVLGTLSIGLSVIISNTEIDTKKPAKVDAVVGSQQVTPVEKTNYSAYYIQPVNYVCNGVEMPMTIITTIHTIGVLMIDTKTGHIYNAAAFEQKFSHCVPVSVGIRRVTSAFLDLYYNRIIDKLYPNNVR